MARFEGQVAIVTGAATGIGYGIARRLAAEGARLVVVDVDGDLGEQSASEISARGSEARLVVGMWRRRDGGGGGGSGAGGLGARGCFGE